MKVDMTDAQGIVTALAIIIVVVVGGLAVWVWLRLNEIEQSLRDIMRKLKGDGREWNGE